MNGSEGGDSMKKWTKPRLIVLTRQKPEENVLCTCKIFDCLGAGKCYATYQHPALEIKAS